MSPVITIGVPVYNVESYVEKSLLSALEQDFTLPYEILVVDDCGTDGSMDIVHRLAYTHPNGDKIRIVSHSRNLGLGQTRNTILDNALGRYLLSLDSDDWLTTNALTVLYEKTASLEADITIGGVQMVSFPDEELLHLDKYPDLFINKPSAGAYYFANHKYPPHIPFTGKLFSIDFLRRHHIKCTHRIMEDTFPYVQTLLYAQKICFVSDITYYYSIRPRSIMTSVVFHNLTNETAEIYTNIIKEVSEFISINYSRVDGVYDLYHSVYSRVFDSILKTKYTDEQMSFIDSYIQGYLDIIPNLRVFQNKHARLLYYCCQSNQTLSQYKFVRTVYSKTIQGRITRNVLNLLPCKSS